MTTESERPGTDAALQAQQVQPLIGQWPYPVQTLDFGGALNLLRAGKRVTRTGWNGKGMWLMLQVPDDHSKMTLPYIYMKTADNNLVPWLASQTDVLACDWMEVRHG